LLIRGEDSTRCRRRVELTENQFLLQVEPRFGRCADRRGIRLLLLQQGTEFLTLGL
jgi:hypothetical protein